MAGSLTTGISVQHLWELPQKVTHSSVCCLWAFINSTPLKMWTYEAFGYKSPGLLTITCPRKGVGCWARRGGGGENAASGQVCTWEAVGSVCSSSAGCLNEWARIKKKKKKIQLKIQDLFSHFKRHSGVEPEDTGVGVGSPVWHSTGSVREGGRCPTLPQRPSSPNSPCPQRCGIYIYLEIC